MPRKMRSVSRARAADGMAWAKSQGFAVLQDKHTKLVQAKAYFADKDIYGVWFAGHGADGFIDFEDTGAGPAAFEPNHKLGSLILFACEAGMHNWEALVSENGKYVSSPGDVTGASDWDRPDVWKGGTGTKLK